MRVKNDNLTFTISTKRKYIHDWLSSDFVIKNRIRKETQDFIIYLYKWLLSGTPPKRFLNRKKFYFFISHNTIAEHFNCTEPSIARRIRKLKELGIICDVIYTKPRAVKKENIKSYKHFANYAFDWDKIIESLASSEELRFRNLYFEYSWIERAKRYKEEEKMGILIPDEELGIKKDYSEYSDAIVRKILTKYPQIFTTRIPKESVQPTRSYTLACKYVDSLYKGTFIKFPLKDNVVNNKQFIVPEDYKEIIKGVKGDWFEVKKLILKCAYNFSLMRDLDCMPFSKKYLQTDIGKWLLNRDYKEVKYQSQFIQSLEEPRYINEKLSIDKQKKIEKEIKEYSIVAYEGCLELQKYFPDKTSEDRINLSIVWKKFKEMLEWAKLMYKYEFGTRYWFVYHRNGESHTGPEIIFNKYVRFLKENNCDLRSIKGLDITTGTCNAPWGWFLHDAKEKHTMNDKIYSLVTEDDFKKVYCKEEKVEVKRDTKKNKWLKTEDGQKWSEISNRINNLSYPYTEDEYYFWHTRGWRESIRYGFCCNRDTINLLNVMCFMQEDIEVNKQNGVPVDKLEMYLKGLKELDSYFTDNMKGSTLEKRNEWEIEDYKRRKGIKDEEKV